MKKSTLKKLDELFKKYPICKGVPSSVNEIKELEKQLNINLPKDYIEFINAYGGAVIGADGIYGIKNSELIGEKNIFELTESFKERGFPIKDTHCVISSDGLGNPIFINAEHMVLIYDHDIGKFQILANTFEDYVEDLLRQREESK